MGHRAQSEKKVASEMKQLVNVCGFQLACARVLREGLHLPVLMYGNEAMVWRVKEKSRIKAGQMDYLSGLLGIRRIDKIPNTLVRE